MSGVDCDIVVIGSGFGGAVCAMRAAEAGLGVVVLERGRRMTPGAYDEIAEGRANLFHRKNAPGLIEIHRARRLVALTGSAVGGGSHLYTGVTVPAPAEVFNGAWPDGFKRDLLDPHYERVAQTLGLSTVPTELRRTQALETIGRRLGADVTRLPLAFDWPDNGADMARRPPSQAPRRQITTILQGGPAARKRTLDHSYLRRAEELGADVRPLHEVQSVTPNDDGYRVDYRHHDDGCWFDGSIAARRVILAAGALNTVRLLLTWRDVSGTLPRLSRSLGERFFTNGDFGALLVGPKLNVAPDAGPPVTAWIDHWQRDRLYLMETGLLPLSIGSSNPPHRLGRVWSFGVMGFDDCPGRLRLNRRGRLVYSFEVRRAAEFHRRRMRCLREMARASKSMLLAPPTFAALRMPVTIHPLGGAVMADSPDRGTCGPTGEVFGHPGLYIADASLLPTPTGVAPSMTIAAVAEHVIENLIRQC